MQKKYDAIVVGAGSAGSAAAVNLARAGLKVALVESRKLSRAGAKWINGLVNWTLDFAEIPHPKKPELIDAGTPTAIVLENGKKAFSFDSHEMNMVDMGLFTRRLHEMCKETGVDIYDRSPVKMVKTEEGRPIAIVCDFEDDNTQKEITLSSSLFVDASGLGGVLRRQIREIDRHCPFPPPENCCSAIQEVCKIDDKAAAKRFLDDLKIPPGYCMNSFGMAGGFSTVMMHIDKECEEVDFVVGASMENNNPSGPDILKDVKKKHSWIGATISGGRGEIPIRRPFDRIAAPGIALIGDSACMTIPIHGSGVGMGIVAGKILADTVSKFHDPGSEIATWTYQQRFQRKFGYMLGAYDIARRSTQPLARPEIEYVFSSQMISPRTVKRGLAQKTPRLDLRELKGIVSGGISKPWLSLRLVSSMGRMPAVMALYRLYPKKPDLGALSVWSRAMAKLFREPPDIAVV